MCLYMQLYIESFSVYHQASLSCPWRVQFGLLTCHRRIGGLPVYVYEQLLRINSALPAVEQVDKFHWQRVQGPRPLFNEMNLNPTWIAVAAPVKVGPCFTRASGS